MKALTLKQHGTLDQVELIDMDKPSPSPMQVLVRTEAAGLNHLDLFVVGGIPGIRLDMPHILGSDGAGVVESVGEGVQRFSPGDRVMLNPGLWCGECEFCIQGEESLCVRFQLTGEHVDGTFAEYFCAFEDNLEFIPENTSFSEAAAFSLVTQTAWRMLRSRAGVQAGDDVFIHGIGGGVATAALQIARLSGARVFVSSSSDSKLEKAARLGADFCYNYKTADIVRAVLKDTHKRGVDIVVDSTGAETWLQSLQMVRKNGRIVSCGATTGPNPQTEIRLIFWKQVQILGSTMSNRSEYRQVVQLLKEGRLKPVIDRIFPLEQGRQALEYLNDEEQFGKLILAVGSDHEVSSRPRAE